MALPKTPNRKGFVGFKTVNWLPVCFQTKFELESTEIIASLGEQDLHCAEMGVFSISSGNTMETP